MPKIKRTIASIKKESQLPTKEIASAVPRPSAVVGAHADTIIALRKIAAIQRKNRSIGIRERAKSLKAKTLTVKKKGQVKPAAFLSFEPPYIFNAATTCELTNENIKALQALGAKQLVFLTNKQDAGGVYIPTGASKKTNKLKRVGRFIVNTPPVVKPISNKAPEVKIQTQKGEVLVSVEMPVLPLSNMHNPDSMNQGELNYKLRLSPKAKKEKKDAGK